MNPADLLRSKARHAWLAACLLADVHPDDSVSRAYYAVFDAVQARAGPGLRHGDIAMASVARAAGLRSAEVSRVKGLYAMRVIADYSAERSMNRPELGAALEIARSLLARLGIPVE